VQRLAEPIQSEIDVLLSLAAAGIEPGTHMTISSREGAVVCTSEKSACAVDLKSAGSIFITLG
jgi:hypothetical protein